MSFLRKIRRRHKAPAFKRSTQSDNADGAASLGSVEDGEDGDEDHEADFTARQADADKVLVLIAASTTPSDQNSSDQGDVSDESLTFIHSYDTKDGDDVNVIGTESDQFWPWIAKSATLLLVSSGAFYIGKVATVGITLCLLLALKLFAGDHNTHSGESSKLGHRSYSDESSSKSQETLHHDGEKVALSDESRLRHFNAGENNGSDIDMEVNEHDDNEENFSNKEYGITLLAKKKQLKRLNCLKLPSSASSFGEGIQESPSSAKGSPRSWFRSAGGVENSAESRKQGKLKSKALFRRLRKGETHSAPPSPLWSDPESINGFSMVSDGSESERTSHGPPAMRRKSKFKPASPMAREFSEANLGSLDGHEFEESLAGGKGEKNVYPPLPDNFTMRKDGKVDGCTAAFCKGNMKQQHVKHFLPKGHFEISSAAATSEEAMAKTDVPELQRRSGGPRQPAVAYTPPVSKEATARGNAAALANPRAAIRRRGEIRKQKKVRVGTAWLTAGLAVITAGLLMGRIVAVAGLICYWYALSLVRKARKGAVENTRKK